MSDRISTEKISWNMSQVRSKDTSIEVKVRKYLFHEGFRFRKNDKKLPGKPDVVLPKYRTVIFVHGCFWHRHEGCKRASMPATRVEFWQTKFNKNVENDSKNMLLLSDLGWHVIVLWECEIKKDFEDVMKCVVSELNTQISN